VKTPGREMCDKESCTRAGGIPPQLHGGRSVLAPMDFTWGQVLAPSKSEQLGSRGAVRCTSSFLEALLMPCQKLATK